MAEEMLYDSESMRQFSEIGPGDDHIPDETTVLNFRYLLEHHALTEAIFTEVSPYLADRGITSRSGTLAGATIIDAPSSTKNRAGARDPEMLSTKRGNGRYFGMKAHIDVDAESGMTHGLETSTARLHESQPWDALLHGAETSVRADKAYVSGECEARFDCPDKFWGVVRKASKGGKLHPVDGLVNRIIAMVRARLDHPFRIVRRQIGCVKTHYWGLAKNRAQLFTLFALGNLFLMRQKLMA